MTKVNRLGLKLNSLPLFNYCLRFRVTLFQAKQASYFMAGIIEVFRFIKFEINGEKFHARTSDVVGRTFVGPLNWNASRIHSIKIGIRELLKNLEFQSENMSFSFDGELSKFVFGCRRQS